MSSRLPAQRIVHAADRAALILEKICGGLCVLCFSAMTVITLLGIFFRYAMNSPFMWTEEAARYLLVWMGFTAISIALKQDKHIKIEVLTGFLPAIGATLVGYLIDLLMAVFFAILLWQGYLMTVNTLMTAATFKISMSWVLAAIPVAALLALAQLFLKVTAKIAAGWGPPPSVSGHTGGETQS